MLEDYNKGTKNKVIKLLKAKIDEGKEVVPALEEFSNDVFHFKIIYLIKKDIKNKIKKVSVAQALLNPIKLLEKAKDNDSNNSNNSNDSIRYNATNVGTKNYSEKYGEDDIAVAFVGGVVVGALFF
jgi:hypothetical protein